MRRHVWATLWIVAPLRLATAQAEELTADQAAQHVGRNATVCGTVSSARYAHHATGRPTFLNFDKPYPRAPFTAVIWGDNRDAFGAPEKALAGKRICITGTIKLFGGRPEMDLTSPSQISRQ